jgi:hypothetical protein
MIIFSAAECYTCYPGKLFKSSHSKGSFMILFYSLWMKYLALYLHSFISYIFIDSPKPGI